jgi:hypothetical protein
MSTSMLKTLAGKHRSSVSKMAAKHKAKIQTPHGLRTCFEACIQRDDRQPLVARFGGIPLQRQKSATVIDRQPIRVDYPHKELVKRLLADTCEICRQTGVVQVHHVRKLADLGTPGPLQPAPQAPRRAADPSALLHWFRRLRIRWEIRDDIHEAFMTLAAAIICWRRLTR